MRINLRLSRIGIILSGIVLFSTSPFSVSNLSAEMTSSLVLNTGYRVDDLDWNIAGDNSGSNPNILSELTWSDLSIYQVNLEGDLLLEWFYMRGSFGYGWIKDGKNQDSDYSGDNRTDEYSRSNNSADSGSVLDRSIAVGYQYKPGAGRIRITPLLGYSHHEQNLTLKDGFQTIPSTGSFSKLDSSYDTSWKGPWAGVDLTLELSRRLVLFSSFEYHWADYRAEGNWNLRTDLDHPKSFEHTAKGNGVLASVGGKFALGNNWYLNASVDYNDWSTDAGTDETFIPTETTTEVVTTDEDGNTTTETVTTKTVTSSFTRLNEVNWSSFAVILGVTYTF